MPYVLGDESARRLKRLLYSPDGNIVNKPGQPKGPILVPPVIRWVRIDDDTAIDTSITDPSLTKDYWNGTIVVYDTTAEDVDDYADVYVSTINGATVAEDTLPCMCVGLLTINTVERLLFMPIGVSASASSSTITLTRCVRLVSA